jgi:hypothetical protein
MAQQIPPTPPASREISLSRSGGSFSEHDSLWRETDTVQQVLKLAGHDEPAVLRPSVDTVIPSLMATGRQRRETIIRGSVWARPIKKGTMTWSYVSPIAVNPGTDGILEALESLPK